MERNTRPAWSEYSVLAELKKTNAKILTAADPEQWSVAAISGDAFQEESEVTLEVELVCMTDKPVVSFRDLKGKVFRASVVLDDRQHLEKIREFLRRRLSTGIRSTRLRRFRKRDGVIDKNEISSSDLLELLKS